MGIINIDGNLFKKMIIGGSNELSKNKQLIDSLNVFPVPDGDTGTNMSLTVLAAAREVEKLNTPNIYDVSKVAATGALRGARGNSGVILSQLFRGFSRGFEGKSLANVDDFANALKKSQEMAYKAVMKPKEGTILTVARALSEKASEMAYDTDDIEVFFTEIIKYGKEVLELTTEMLPELKQASVVDAGGKGLICILEGAFNAMLSKEDITIDAFSKESKTENSSFGNINTEDIKFAYCTEFFINVKEVTDAIEDNLKNYLQSVGDSIVLVGDTDIIKIHVHTNHPGSVLEKCLKVGTLSNLKIENMKEQHSSIINFVEEKAKINTPQKEIGFVVVSMGEGLSGTFKSLGADMVIEGGQSMNPSTDDILLAIEKVNAKSVIVLPNNKNIILAAQQAEKLCKDKKVIVIPSKSIPQGISALIQFLPQSEIDENIESMTNGIRSVKTGQVTYAVRNTVVNHKEIKEGNILCMLEGDIKHVAEELQAGSKELLLSMIEEGNEFLTIYYGKDATLEQANELSDFILEKYPECEVEVQKGDQPLYYYIFSAE